MAANGKIVIERGIPAPTGRRNNKYPWAEMEVGDSFLFPQNCQHAYETTRTASKRYKPKKFVAQTTADGMRCWRVE